MNTAPLRHLPDKIELGYTEAMCGEVITDDSMICGDPAWATCARCVEINRSEENHQPNRSTRPTVSDSDDIAGVVSSSPWFSDRARHVVMAAYQEAAGRGHDQVGTRHLVLALLGDEGCAAYRVLTELGVTRQAADKRVGFFTMEMCPSDPWVDKDTEQALVYALREASRLGHDLAGTGHVLQGVLRDKHGSGPYLLKLIGADPVRARERLLYDEGPAAVPYPLPVIKILGRRELAVIDNLLVRCREGLSKERGS